MPGHYIFLGSFKPGISLGHPGVGRFQDSQQIERYAITAYTISLAGNYSINDAFLKNTDFSSDGLQLRILADSKLIVSGSTNHSLGSSFTISDVNLGYLNAGSTIYVAVGPGNTDYGCPLSTSDPADD